MSKPNPNIDEFVEIIQRNDMDEIESARDWVQPDQIDALCEYYWQLNDWDQKCALVEILQDQFSEKMKGIMLDYLRAPYGPEEDRIEQAKAVALGFYDEQYNITMIYYQDRERLRKDVYTVLTENDLSIEGDSLSQPDSFSNTARPQPTAAIPNVELDINHRGPDGDSHLHREASMGCLENIKKLLDMGADIDAIGGQGRTALFSAASSGQAEATKLLVEHGANMHLGLTNMVGDKPDGRTPVTIAATYGKTDCVEILINAGCDPDTSATGGTLLMTAASYNFYDMAERLIALGANVNAQHDSPGYPQAAGYTPLVFAVRAGLPKMVSLFLNNGADPNYQVQPNSPTYVYEFNTGKNSEKIDQLLRSAGAKIPEN